MPSSVLPSQWVFCKRFFVAQTTDALFSWIFASCLGFYEGLTTLSIFQFFPSLWWEKQTISNSSKMSSFENKHNGISSTRILEKWNQISQSSSVELRNQKKIF
jgi:hypothetical protein